MAPEPEPEPEPEPGPPPPEEIDLAEFQIAQWLSSMS